MITPAEAQLMRFRLVANLDEEPFIDILDRFVWTMFRDEYHLKQWCEGWGLTYEHITFHHLHRVRQNWTRFRKP